MSGGCPLLPAACAIGVRRYGARVELRSASDPTSPLAHARAAYPGVVLTDDEYFAHLEAKTGGGWSRDVRTAELFLARACAKRDPAAIAYLERDTFDEVEAAYRRFSGLGLTLEDVKQRLLETLCLRDRPAIAGYAGTGALRGWVRAAALHMLLNIAQRETREEPTDEALFDVMIGSDASAEAAYVKLSCRAELETALALAMSRLSDRERCLLRYAFVDGRNVDEIGAIYGVHRATAARWVASARAQLVDLTRDGLVSRLGISETEARSIIAAALSGVGSLLLQKLGGPPAGSSVG
jgi:RNA polymerase sigma-70 factor (ECF subfamily)